MDKELNCQSCHENFFRNKNIKQVYCNDCKRIYYKLDRCYNIICLRRTIHLFCYNHQKKEEKDNEDEMCFRDYLDSLTKNKI